MRAFTIQFPVLHQMQKDTFDLLKGIFGAVRHINEARQKSRRVSAFWSMSDTELTLRGFRREDTIRLVMADAI